MSHENESTALAEPQRKQIFLALVEAQDQRVDVQKSRKLVAEQYGISERQLREIEEEGLDQEWPPL